MGYLFCLLTAAVWLFLVYANSLLASLNARKVLRRESLEDSCALKSDLMTPIFPTEKASFLHRTVGSDSA